MKLLALLLLLQQRPLMDKALSLDTIRHLYYQAATNKIFSEKLSALLSVSDTSSVPVLVCYKGAAEMVKARYAINPYIKLKDFNKGKTWIETAIERDTAEIEMRFLRFTIQTNLPSFLKYNSSIMTDKNFLLTHFSSLSDHQLKENIYRYLSGSEYCTEEEIKKLKL